MTRYAQSELENNTSNTGMINTNAVVNDNQGGSRPGKQAREDRRAKRRNQNETNATPHDPEYANFDE